MRDGGGVNFYGFSSRHIRLKYQAVSSAIAASLIAVLTVDKVKIPGLVEFTDQPPLWVIQIAVVSFAMFSLVSFHFQTRIERKHIPLTGLLFKNEIDRQYRDLIEKSRSLTGESYKVYGRVITKEIASLPPKIVANTSNALRWQPMAKHFFDIQSAANFAQIQMNVHSEGVASEVYQGNQSFDRYYSTTLDMFAAKIENFINNVWRPNDLRKTIGGVEYTSNVIQDLAHLNSLAIALGKQNRELSEDLSEYVKLKDLNQELLSVRIPYGLCVGLLIFAIITTIRKVLGL